MMTQNPEAGALHRTTVTVLLTVALSTAGAFVSARTGTATGHSTETPLQLAGFNPVKNPPADSTTEARDEPRVQSPSGRRGEGARGQSGSGHASGEPLDIDTAIGPPGRKTPRLDSLINQLMDTGEAIEGRPGGTDRVESSWFNTLIFTRSDNPMLERNCRRDALQYAVDTLAEEHDIKDRDSAINAARSHMSTRQTFINENGISYADYLKTVAECTEFCAPLISSLMECHIVSISQHPRSILVFEFDSHEVDQRYTNGVLNVIARRLKENEDLNVLLVGRASKIGGLRYNRMLAGQRALAVSDRLRSKRIASERIKTMWFGWEPPQIDNTVAEQYQIEGLYEELGRAGINQSVVVVLYSSNDDPGFAMSGTDG